MADHQAELTDLCAQPGVDPDRVGVTGVSMGGTHTLWLAAIDPRVRAAVGVAVAPLTRPETSFLHHCFCDTMVGLYEVADEEVIQALAAPRALLRITPGVQAPLTAEGWRQFVEGWVGIEEALRRYAMTPDQVRELHRYTHDVFRQAGVADAYGDEVVQGPHDYTPAMRETAARWFARHLLNEADTRVTPEPPLAPIADRAAAIAALDFWPQGDRPAAVLGPTAYVQREVAALTAHLPPAPADPGAWTQERSRLCEAVRACLRVPLASAEATTDRAGEVQAQGSVVHKLIVRPEAGIQLPLLLFEPAPGATANRRLSVLLHPGGMAVTSGSETRRSLSRAGAWVLCVDLRGMGETRYDGESGAYLGFRDLDMALGALKLGNTLAGHWVKDLLAAIAAVQAMIGATPPLRVIVRGEREAGLVAILAAGQSPAIDEVETQGLLASYTSPKGYGLPFAYSDENNSKAIRQRPLGGYGSMVPCIPHLLKHADTAQLAALVAPRPLLVAGPLWANGQAQSTAEAESTFAWTRAAYRLSGAEPAFRLVDGPAGN
jgi:acetyl esterase/lipase